MASGCATYSDRTATARDAVARGDLDGGVAELNKFMDTRGEELPKKWKGDTGLAVLERGTIFHAQGKWETSAKDLQAAEKELELLDISKNAVGKIGKYIYSDSAAKYKTPPTERLTLNAVNMLNYLTRGDLDGARVEAKRFTTMREYLKQEDPDHAHAAFGSYLAGFTFERLGEWDTAVRYYDEALQEKDFASLHVPLARLATKSSYRTERLNRYMESMDAAGSTSLAGPAADVTPTELLVVVNVGRVPYKVPRRIPIGAAIGIAHTFITGDTRVLEHTAMKVVTFPELVPAGNTYDSAAVQIDGKSVAVERVSDLGLETKREYDELKPKIIGAAITRMIARAIAAEGARAAGNQAGDAGPIVGLLAALAVEGTMVALDKPDTRSWTLMPNQVNIARVRLPPGKHTVSVWLQSSSGAQERRDLEVELAAGGFAVVDVTSLR
jgi:hypothetical protein